VCAREKKRKRERERERERGGREEVRERDVNEAQREKNKANSTDGGGRKAHPSRALLRSITQPAGAAKLASLYDQTTI